MQQGIQSIFYPW